MSLPEKVVKSWVDKDNDKTSRNREDEEVISDFDTFDYKRVALVTSTGRVALYSYNLKGSSQIYTSDQN